jgi:hypothetical protein
VRYVILFSPAIVLAAMTIAVYIDERLKDSVLVPFLFLLTISVIGAEVMRIRIRRNQ